MLQEYSKTVVLYTTGDPVYTNYKKNYIRGNNIQSTSNEKKTLQRY